MNSKYNWKIRNVIYQAIFVRISVLAKYTCVCALHTLTDEFSTAPASAVPAFTPLVRQEELGQLCKAGQTRKEKDRLKNPSPYFEEKVTLENTKSRVEVKKEERKILQTGTGGQYKRVQVCGSC